MLSKDEVYKYLEQMKKNEKMMENTYSDLANQVKNEKYKKDYEQMVKDEIDHFEKIEALEKLIDKL